MARKKSGLSARDLRAAKSGRRIPTDEEIDFSDIPECTDEQLASMKRVGRPPLGEQTKQLVAIRLEPRMIQLLKEAAIDEKMGYQSLINFILWEYLRERGTV